MAAPKSKITSQGQTSVPAEIRRKLGVGPGSVLQWEEVDGNIVVRKFGKYTFEDIHKALFKTPPKPRTLEELDEAKAEYIREKFGKRARR